MVVSHENENEGSFSSKREFIWFLETKFHQKIAGGMSRCRSKNLGGYWDSIKSSGIYITGGIYSSEKQMNSF